MENKLLSISKTYGFEILRDGCIISICSKNIDGVLQRWVQYNKEIDTVTIAGNTDHLNIWLYQTRPDLTKTKIIDFVNDLNNVFELDNDNKIELFELIDQEDWQEIEE